jgi:hypothetical protein
LRLTSASPSSRPEAYTNGAQPPTPTRRLESVQIPAPQMQASGDHQQPFQPVQPWVDGPSLSPRGQALGPPGIHRSEAAYGSPYNGANSANGSSSPVRPRFSPGQSSRPNGFPTSSPPPFNLPQLPSSPAKSHPLPHPHQNGNSFNLSNPFGSSQHAPPHAQSFNRPASSAGHPGSPVKHSHSPTASPRPANGLPTAYNFNSPRSSFPPSSAHRPSFSPTKHSSPAPNLAHMSSPVPAPAALRIAPSPSQMPAQVLPDPIPAPSKHDGMRPKSSHEVSETSVFPPSQSLSPQRKMQNLSPPVKKSSPVPERVQFAPLDQNGVNGSH